MVIAYKSHYVVQYAKKCIFNTSITKDIEIWSLHDFHDNFQGLESVLQKRSEKNKNNTSPLYKILQCTLVPKWCLELSILKQFDIKINMRIITSYTSIPADKKKKKNHIGRIKNLKMHDKSL